MRNANAVDGGILAQFCHDSGMVLDEDLRRDPDTERGEDLCRDPDTMRDEELRSADAHLRVPRSGVEYEMPAATSLCMGPWASSLPPPRLHR